MIDPKTGIRTDGKKYVLYGGHVRSRHDGDTHWISAHSLIALYRLDPRECLVSADWAECNDIKGLTVLRPDPTGEYKLPESLR